jgi:hypothetical protein
MKRIMVTAALSAVGALALAGAASADIGDIDDIDVDGAATGTAGTAEISGTISCTTTIEYGLILKVTQLPPDVDEDQTRGFENSDVEGVGAFGPASGNSPNSPCSTNIQSWELVVQRNRNSAGYSDSGAAAPPDNMGVVVIAGTSAEDGTRGPGPFIGDFEYETDEGVDFERTDP